MDVLPKLDALLAADPDPDFAARTRMVCEAAGRTVAQLGELELVQYEEPEVDGSADLSTWEKVAPVIASTLAEVNTLLAQTEISFPLGERFHDARQAQIQALVQALSADLKTAVMQFGMRVRDPSVVGDRWNLINELQAVRGRFRDRIGSVVWEIGALSGECHRLEIEPGYEAALANTLLIRSMTADLRRLMRARIHKVSECGPGEALTQAQQIERELNAFGRTAAWRTLRAFDKKGILEFRQKIRELVARGNPTKIDVLEVLEPFVEFVDGFAGISQRKILVQHDQERLASVGLLLERAMNAALPDERLLAYREALAAGETLYGRAPDFDVFLRNQRKSALSPETLPETIEQFVVQIAGLSQY